MGQAPYFSFSRKINLSPDPPQTQSEKFGLAHRGGLSGSAWGSPRGQRRQSCWPPDCAKAGVMGAWPAVIPRKEGIRRGQVRFALDRLQSGAKTEPDPFFPQVAQLSRKPFVLLCDGASPSLLFKQAIDDPASSDVNRSRLPKMAEYPRIMAARLFQNICQCGQEHGVEGAGGKVAVVVDSLGKGEDSWGSQEIGR